MDKVLKEISGAGTLAKAIRYATSRWPALTRYTTDGRLEMTNNAAERAIRPLDGPNHMAAGGSRQVADREMHVSHAISFHSR
jgi:hypothetical protein